MKKIIIAGMLILILVLAGQVQAGNHESSPIFTTPYNGTLFFCLSTNPPLYTNCAIGYRQIRVHTPDYNGLYIQSCFQFLFWICDNSFWMIEQDVWYTETVDFPHLRWKSSGKVESYTETPEVWNKLLMGENKFIPLLFGPFSEQDPYPGPEKMTQPEGLKLPLEKDKRAYP